MYPKPKPSYSERGQAIVIIAGALVGIIGIMGLMIDVGILFIDSSRLKRSVDAAAISAALQYREGYSDSELSDAATEFVQLNEGNATDIIVEVCNADSTLHQPDLCPPVTDPPTPPKKVVRVSASKFIDFGFLPVLGINGTTIRTNAIGEAASIDLVFVIDASESMAYETDASKLNPADFGSVADYQAAYEALAATQDDPAACNAADDCEPFRSIKNVAIDFVDTLYFPYDRVSVVTFDRVAHSFPSGAGFAPWIEDADGDGIAKDEVISIIDGLNVYQPGPCVSVDPPNPAVGTCLSYDGGGNFQFINCMPWEYSGRVDPTSCTSSNIGGGLALAGNSFAQAPIREDSLWIVILLAGGPANATDAFSGFPMGSCPSAYWDQPFCRDDEASDRHVSGETLYDGDDFARDMADFVTDPDAGQGAIVFSIGLGEKINNDRIRGGSGDPDIAEQLLIYAAEGAGGTSNVGVYYNAPGQAELRDAFRQIAENIATRITH